MIDKKLNRIKAVQADKDKTNKWLTEQLGKDPATVSKWCTNASQPTLETLLMIAKFLDVEVNDLVRLEAEND
ncbi:helix-turn-helix transcriptional regulator [Prevotella jejuni]|jgi:putative transcriptional regulator|uniref:helix-turn-helix transcriptional regulator n=1 Tax=Prevotella jejuni TaxID=1177574 RepID=UPI00352F22BD